MLKTVFFVMVLDQVSVVVPLIPPLSSSFQIENVWAMSIKYSLRTNMDGVLSPKNICMSSMHYETSSVEQVI